MTFTVIGVEGRVVVVMVGERRGIVFKGYVCDAGNKEAQRHFLVQSTRFSHVAKRQDEWGGPFSGFVTVRTVLLTSDERK